MRHVEIQDGVGPVALPNGNVYQEGEDAYLTESEWDQLTPGAKANLVTLLGTEDDPGDETSEISAEVVRAQGVEASLQNQITRSSLKPTGVKTASYQASPGEYVPVDTTAGSPVITLPNNPEDGTQVAVKRVAGVTNNASVVCAGVDVLNVAGGATTATVSLVNMQFNFVYAKTAHIWYVETSMPKGTLDGLYSGKLLGYAQNTSDTTLGASVTPIALIGGGLSSPVTVGTKPIKVAYGGVCYHSGGSQGPGLALYEDGVRVDSIYFSTALANQQVPMWREIPRTPAAGAHTYEVRLFQTLAAATAHAFGSVTTPLLLNVTEA